MFYNPSPPRMSCPWTFFQNIGFNMVPSDPFMSHLLLNLDILQGSFRLCNWLSLRRLVSWINHLPPACWSTFWKSILNTSWAVGLTYWIAYLHIFFVFWHMQLYVLIHHIIFWLYLHFLNILYFFKYSCTNIFHRRSFCTFYCIG